MSQFGHEPLADDGYGRHPQLFRNAGNGLGCRIARAVHAFQTFERLAQRVQAVQAFRREDEHAAVLLVFLGQRHFVVVLLITVEQFLRVSIGFARSIGTFAISDQAVIALIARFARKCRNWPARCHLPRLPERACPTIQAPRQDGARCLRCRR